MSNTKQDKPLFLSWLEKHSFQLETPVVIQDKFRNLEDPIAYNENEDLLHLKHKFEKCRSELKQQKDATLQFSKNVYKKVISQENAEFVFGNSSLGSDRDFLKDSLEVQKRSTKKHDDRYKYDFKRKELEKEFLHGDYDRIMEKEKIIRPMDMSVIKNLDDPDVGEKFSNVEFINLFIKNSHDNEKFTHPYEDISNNFQMDELIFRMRFPLIENDNYYGPKSSQLLFKADEQLDFWRKNISEEEQWQNTRINEIDVIKRCHLINQKNPTAINILQFGSGKLTGQMLFNYLQVKKMQQAEMNLDANEQNLQEQYNRKKQQYEFLRQLKAKDKNKKINIKFIAGSAQTIDVLDEQSFDQYFQENTKDLILKLKELNDVRDVILEKEDTAGTKKTMLVNVGYEIKDLLFRMLCQILRKEKFPLFEEYLTIDDKNVAERKILELIYHSFDKIRHPTVDGISKTDIINLYLQERAKNEKMFELIGRTMSAEK